MNEKNGQTLTMGQRLEWKDVWFIELNYIGSDLQNDLISFFAVF